jgi:hypothetical protein
VEEIVEGALYSSPFGRITPIARRSEGAQGNTRHKRMR